MTKRSRSNSNIKHLSQPDVMAHIVTSVLAEAEAGIPLSSRSSWSAYQSSRTPRTTERDPVSKTNKTNRLKTTTYQSSQGKKAGLLS